MNLEEMLQIIEPILGYPLDEEQRRVVNHGSGPLWVVAGPGSGKTEVLVIRTLKLIFVDEINPKSIIITTFTKKAAKNLFDRIINYASYIFQSNPDLEDQIDIHELRVGTLHGLCNDIMQEYRYPEYENYRLLDDLEQYLFIYEHSDLVRDGTDKYLPLWERFDYLVNYWDPITGSRGWNNRDRPPNKWRRAKAAVKLFNRIVEDMCDLNVMQNADEEWQLLVDVYRDYSQTLDDHNRCDFSHVQKKFIEFLNSPLGSLFLNGNGSDVHPGIKHVMVDEYQDTNPIQEKIYFKLTEDTHNLCVVGDDDQALYRFRGGTVDCMVTFDQACRKFWGIQQNQVTTRFLNANYRSHLKIVNYYDEYITSFDSMSLNGARVSGKPSLSPMSDISGSYPAVAYITGQTIKITANNFARFVRDLLDNEIIESPSQCALLMRSVKETPWNAEHFADALRDIDIEPYNPRSRTFLEQEEIMVALGAFISVIDPDLSALNSIRGDGILGMVGNWVNEYQRIASISQELSDYVNESVSRINSKPVNTWLDVNILEIFYRILAHEPFATWEDDPERTYRLGKLSKLFETYASIPYQNSPGSNRGSLKTSSTSQGQISFRWRQNFYYSFVGLLVSKGQNDPEDEEIICPPDRLPIMTVHQAKGLEFPFVFMYGLSQSPKTGDSIRLEEDLSQFRQNPSLVNFNVQERAEQDLIRFYYVAYSRSQYALIHLVPRTHLKDGGFGLIGQSVNRFKDHVIRL